MATISGGGSTTTPNLGSNDANGASASVANMISSGLNDGSITRTSAGSNPSTGAGLVTLSVPGGQTALAPANLDVIVASGGGSSTVVGSGGQSQLVLIDNTNVTFFSKGGSGTVIVGDGNDLIGVPAVGGGNFTITLGAGQDTVTAFSGQNTIYAGSGRELIGTGATNTLSANLIYVQSASVTVTGGSGAGMDTIIGGTGSALIIEGSKSYTFNGNGQTGSVSTVGGTGSATVYAGSGSASIAGGTNGSNQLFGSQSAAPVTLTAGGNNDLLVARGTGPTTLTAASGNETLQGGAGSDLFQVTLGRAAQVTIQGFVPGQTDRVQILNGGSVSTAIASISSGSASPAGSVVTLTDGTKITFAGYTSASSGNFLV